MARLALLTRSAICGAVLFGIAPALLAQDLPSDKPVPLHTPAPSKAERDRAEAATLYGLGALNEGKHRLLEALRCYEEACKLDPEAVAPRRALVPLYLAIDRLDDALVTAKRVLQLDPDDWETGTLCTRELRALGKPKEATEVLRRAAVSPRLKERADALAQVWADLANLEEDIGEWKRAAETLVNLADMLDHPAPLIEQDTITAEEAKTRAAETYENIGRIWLKAGDTAKAIAAFETARARDPGRSGRLALHLAEIHDKAGRPREALARLDDYLAGRPSGTEAYEMKIRLLKQLHEENNIVPALQSARAADQHNIALALLLARELRRSGQGNVAEGLYKELLRDGPSPDIYRGLFGLYKEFGQPGGFKALGLLDETVRNANPDNQEAEQGPPMPGRRVHRASRNEDTPETSAARGRAMLIALREDPETVKLLLAAAKTALQQQVDLNITTRKLLAALGVRTRQFDASEALYRSCITPGGPPREDEHDCYIELLLVLQKQYKYKEVIDLCKQGLEIARGTNRVLFFDELRAAYVALGQFKEALDAADEAEKLADPPNRLYCQSQRVRTLSQAGKHTDAIAACQAMLREYNQAKVDEDAQAREKRSENIRKIRLQLSEAYNVAREFEKSDEQLRLILEEDENDETANNNLGFQWAERGVNLEEAERLVRKALERDRNQRSSGKAVGLDADRDNAAYVDSLGWVLFRKGDLKGARAELERAVTLPDGEDDPVVWDHLADVLFRSGEKDKAASAWHKALTLFEAGTRPKDDRYREIQQKLKQTAP